MGLGSDDGEIMKCVVIGGSGFIGSRLIPELQSAYDVVNMDKVKSALFGEMTHLMDVRNPDSFSNLLQGVDTVVLLAAEHRDDVTPVSLYHDVNVQGMRNVLAAMNQHGVRRIVFTSTVALYGLDTSAPPKECDQVDPFNEYGRSKWEAECVLQEWVAQGDGRSALVLRPSVIFGEGNRGNVFNLLKQIHSGKFLMIGDGRNQKSMAYIGNVVAFIRFMLETKWEGVEIFNYLDTPDFDMNTLVSEVYRFKGEAIPKLRIPYGVGITVSQLFDLAATVTGRKFPISSIRIKKFCANTMIDGAKLNATGFVRPFSLVEGLQKMLKAEF